MATLLAGIMIGICLAGVAFGGNLFAGSVFSLEPGTTYEVECSLKDPDGGAAVKTAEARTRVVPKAFDKGSRLHVYPQGYEGKRETPSFGGIAEAYDTASPGDVILIHGGAYKGPFVFAKSGVKEKPIVLRGAGDGEAVIVGTGTACLIDVHKAGYLHFENLIFRDPGTVDGGSTVEGVTILAANCVHGRPRPKDVGGIVVRRCRFEDFGVGIMAADGLCRDFTITDNVFVGRRSMDRGEWENAHFRNNLFLSSARGGTYSPYTSFDYNGYMPEAGKPIFSWTRLKEGETEKLVGFLKCKTAAEARRHDRLLKKETVVCKTLPEASRKLGFEEHGKLVDYSIFQRVGNPLEAAARRGALHLYEPGELDFSLKPDSKAVDAGVRLANINEGYAGRAPDLGALEAGKPAPQYGPRED